MPPLRVLYVLLSLFPLAATAIAADTYPSPPIRVVVPFAPGGASDFVGRVIEPLLSGALGQNVVIENRAGASGYVGVEIASQAR